MSSDEARFHELKALFGPENDADTISLVGYGLLPDKDVEDLILRVKNYRYKIELLLLRERARETARATAKQAVRATSTARAKQVFQALPAGMRCSHDDV